MKFSQFGADNGRVVVYFHGAPGAPEECAIFDPYGKENGLTFICFDRFSLDASLQGEAYYQVLATQISDKAAGERMDIIGFSIGAFIALQTCRYMADGVRNLHLVSAAAPLDAGNFLEAMAGKQVFQLAKAHPLLFSLLTRWQGFLALLVPDALFRLIFAGATGGDKELVARPDFQSSIKKLLKSCFTGRAKGYARDITAYVQPWKDTLTETLVNTHIWHGVEDNWSPKSMAEYLASAIPGGAQIELLDNLSHYSCLYEAAPRICDRLGMA